MDTTTNHHTTHPRAREPESVVAAERRPLRGWRLVPGLLLAALLAAAACSGGGGGGSPVATGRAPAPDRPPNQDTTPDDTAPAAPPPPADDDTFDDGPAEPEPDPPTEDTAPDDTAPADGPADDFADGPAEPGDEPPTGGTAPGDPEPAINDLEDDIRDGLWNDVLFDSEVLLAQPELTFEQQQLVEGYHDLAVAALDEDAPAFQAELDHVTTLNPDLVSDVLVTFGDDLFADGEAFELEVHAP